MRKWNQKKIINWKKKTLQKGDIKMDINYGEQEGFGSWFEHFIDLFDKYFAVISVGIETEDVDVDIMEMDWENLSVR